MEHGCHQCGSPVEDGTPFCPNCRAPQIRVAVHPPSEAVTPPLLPGTPEDMQPPAEPIMLRAPRGLGRSGIDWRVAFGPCLAAGVLAGIGTVIPFVPFILLCIMAAGGISVTLYRRRTGHAPLLPSQGFRVGLFAGLLGFGLQCALFLLSMTSMSARSQMRTAIMGRLQEAAASSGDPAARQAVEQFGGILATDRGLLVAVLLSLAVFGVLMLIMSGIGGMLGATLFGRNSAEKP